MLRTALEEIGRARELRASRWLAGRDEQGTRTTAPEESSTWIVTAISPVLMGQPLTGGPAVSITSTDALKGVAVGMRVRVEVRGVASRVGVALVDPLPISTRDAGETVATINGRQLDVGGSVSLSSSDVGALPNTANYSDVGALPATANYATVDAASETHRHTVAMQSYSANSWDKYAYIGAAPGTYDTAYLNQLRNQINSITVVLGNVEYWVDTTARNPRTTSTPTT